MTEVTEQETTSGEASRSAWPADLAYRAWRMTAVRILLLVLVVGAGFGLGTWYGWWIGDTEEAGAAGATPPGEDILYWSCS